MHLVASKPMRARRALPPAAGGNPATQQNAALASPNRRGNAEGTGLARRLSQPPGRSRGPSAPRAHSCSAAPSPPSPRRLPPTASTRRRHEAVRQREWSELVMPSNWTIGCLPALWLSEGVARTVFVCRAHAHSDGLVKRHCTSDLNGADIEVAQRLNLLAPKASSQVWLGTAKRLRGCGGIRVQDLARRLSETSSAGMSPSLRGGKNGRLRRRRSQQMSLWLELVMSSEGVARLCEHVDGLSTNPDLTSHNLAPAWPLQSARAAHDARARAAARPTSSNRVFNVSTKFLECA